ncbi:MAG: hypothetical protein Q9M34_07135 [Sulfurimonas sp.]|nr:hypothetical protein [Sulfurimonas sp.]
MQTILKQFFEVLNEEEFEKGSVLMLDEVQAKTDEQKLRSFCSKFLKAKHLVEISYSYAQARVLYEEASEIVYSMQNDVLRPLAKFAGMQAAILRIDRAIYTGYAPQMKEAALSLQEKSADIIKGLSEVSRIENESYFLILAENLLQKVQEDKVYADAIMIVADLYLERWSNVNIQQRLDFVQESVQKLEDTGNTRLASDLAPHIHVLKRFKERRKNAGKLYVKNGQVAFYYYASLDYRILEEFNVAIYKADKGNGLLSKELEKILGTSQMVSEEMSDIWSGLASREFVDTYKFILSPLQISQFREIKNYTATVELKYYTMGVFEIKISFSIDNKYLQESKNGMSLSALRHLQTLGTPFALDEKIEVQELGESYGFLCEYVDKKFAKLQKNILDFLKDSPDIALLPDKKALTFDSQHKRFTLVRINKIVENFAENSKPLRSSEFKNHFQYKALVMPVREVRSAIDNWIMYDSSVIDENLASIRYNESEWLSVNPYSAIVGLLEQPVWVFDQAMESVEVAAGVSNLLALSNIQASTQLSNIKKAKEVVHTKLKSKRLKSLKESIEAEIGQLDEFKMHLSNLLETVEAGSMMTYPDHSILMEKIFDIMKLERQKNKAAMLQKEIKDSRSKSMELIKKINEAVVYSQQKVIKLFVSIASVFIALGSLVDMFQLWSNSDTIKSMGLDDASGDFKLEFVLFLTIASTAWLIYDNYFRAKA